MSQFPALLDTQRRALFEMVEAFRKHKMEGRAATILGDFRADPGLPFLMDDNSEPPYYIDTDFDTLRVLDEAGYVAFTETPHRRRNGTERIHRSLTLKRLASDYYDWAHSSAIHRYLSGLWYSLRPFVLPALVSSVFTLLVWMILNWLSGRQASILP